jgi:hypothetical protein
MLLGLAGGGDGGLAGGGDGGLAGGGDGGLAGGGDGGLAGGGDGGLAGGGDGGLADKSGLIPNADSMEFCIACCICSSSLRFDTSASVLKNAPPNSEFILLCSLIYVKLY